MSSSSSTMSAPLASTEEEEWEAHFPCSPCSTPREGVSRVFGADDRSCKSLRSPSNGTSCLVENAMDNLYCSNGSNSESSITDTINSNSLSFPNKKHDFQDKFNQESNNNPMSPTRNDNDFDDCNFTLESCFSASLEDLVHSFDEKIANCFRDYDSNQEPFVPVQVRTHEELLSDNE